MHLCSGFENQGSSFFAFLFNSCWNAKRRSDGLKTRRYRAMKIKRKIHKDKIRTLKNDSILHTSRCTVNQIKTEL